jgi:hypothetical protein
LAILHAITVTRFDSVHNEHRHPLSYPARPTPCSYGAFCSAAVFFL